MTPAPPEFKAAAMKYKLLFPTDNGNKTIAAWCKETHAEDWWDETLSIINAIIDRRANRKD